MTERTNGAVGAVAGTQRGRRERGESFTIRSTYRVRDIYRSDAGEKLISMAWDTSRPFITSLLAQQAAGCYC